MIFYGCSRHLIDRVAYHTCSYVGLFPIVTFLDMFLKDLSNVPQERDINFAIDSEPDTKPISISPYRMTHAELKKFKK